MGKGICLLIHSRSGESFGGSGARAVGAGRAPAACSSFHRKAGGLLLSYQAAPTSLGHWPQSNNCCTFILQSPRFHKNEKQNKSGRLFLKCFPWPGESNSVLRTSCWPALSQSNQKGCCTYFHLRVVYRVLSFPQALSFPVLAAMCEDTLVSVPFSWKCSSPPAPMTALKGSISPSLCISHPVQVSGSFPYRATQQGTHGFAVWLCQSISVRLIFNKRTVFPVLVITRQPKWCHATLNIKDCRTRQF